MDITTISVRNHSVAEVGVEPTQTTAEGGARCPRLLIPFHIRPRANPPWAIDSRIMTLVAVRYELREAPAPHRVLAEGCAFPAVDIRDYSVSMQLPLPLDPQRIREIEDYRAARSLDLRLDAFLIVGLPPDIPRTAAEPKQPREWVLTDVNSVPAQINFQIPQSTWIEKILPHLQDADLELVELPLGRGRIESAAGYLKSAEGAFFRWDAKSVYANCREMATALDTALRQSYGADRFLLEERWGRAYGRFDHLASLDLHLEGLKQKQGVDSEQVRLGRHDVEHLLLAAKLLLKYANDLLPEA